MKKKIFLFFCFMVSIFLLQLDAFTFLVNSDTHVGNNQLPNYILKSSQRPRMLSLIQQLEPQSSVIFVGDLTDTGRDEEWLRFFMEWCHPLLVAKADIRLCRGNHDLYAPWYHCLLKSNIKDRYSFTKGGVKFICCGRYPNVSSFSPDWFPSAWWDTMTWLKHELISTGGQAPIVIYFHFNIVGAFSDWWSKEVKNEFFNLIRHYNIQCIFTGHNHSTFTHNWRNTIPTVCVGGKYFAIASYENNQFDVAFQDKDGNTKEYNELLRNDYPEL